MFLCEFDLAELRRLCRARVADTHQVHERVRLTRDRRPAPKLVAVFADPVFSASDSRVHSDLKAPSLVGLADLVRLVSSRREAAAISALAPEKQRWEALDFDAGLAAVRDPKLADFRILHFATHGLMNSRDPRVSGLVFSLVDREGRPAGPGARIHVCRYAARDRQFMEGSGFGVDRPDVQLLPVPAGRPCTGECSAAIGFS